MAQSKTPSVLGSSSSHPSSTKYCTLSTSGALCINKINHKHGKHYLNQPAQPPGLRLPLACLPWPGPGAWTAGSSACPAAAAGIEAGCHTPPQLGTGPAQAGNPLPKQRERPYGAEHPRHDIIPLQSPAALHFLYQGYMMRRGLAALPEQAHLARRSRPPPDLPASPGLAQRHGGPSRCSL